MVIRHLVRWVSVCVVTMGGMAYSASSSSNVTTDLLQGFSFTRTTIGNWKPMMGSKPVARATIEGRLACKMTCNFENTSMDRASWDHSIVQDLSVCQGLQFWFFCPDISPVSSFVAYLHSEAGWYRGQFDAPVIGQWTLVRIHKNSMQVEGHPGGWSKIDTIRISAWRGHAKDTQFYVTQFAWFHHGANTVVLSGDSAAQNMPSELEAVGEYTKVMSHFLEETHLPHLVMSDLDMTAQKLENTSLLILPYNPGMSDETVQEIARFLQAGGKLLACYHLPDLAPITGIHRGPHLNQPYKGYFASIRPGAPSLVGMPEITSQASWNIQQASVIEEQTRVAAWWYTAKGKSTGQPAVLVSDQCVYLTHVLLPDDANNKLRLLLSMIGTLVPELWSEAASGAMDSMGCFGPYENYETAKQGIRELASTNDVVPSLLEAVDQLHILGRSLVSRQKYPEAIDVAQQAHTFLIDAYCRAQQSLPGEHRAFWCHSAFGVEGMTWDEATQHLADNGFTAIFPNMLWGGVGFYNSEILPVSPSVKDRGDQIELCVAGCKKQGVECHVWKVNFNMGWHTDQSFVNHMKSLNRVQVSFDGSINERWLCPSHPDNQRLEVDSMVEVVRKYEVDGVHFDYIRYPGPDGCFCTGCKARFEDFIGTTIGHWPSDVRDDPLLRQKWLEFRRAQITAVVAAVSTEARAVKRDIQLSAAVFRNWPTDRDNVGQDWKLWCDRGYLDFVCPMDYFSSNVAFKQAVEQQLEWAGQVPCYPGIGLSVWENASDVVQLIEQINITRTLGTQGFTIFNYGLQQARDVLPNLGKGITNDHE